MDIKARALSLLNRLVRYKGELAFIVLSKGDCCFLQHYQHLPCCKTGRLETHKGRKFYLSEHMTDSEIIQTALMAVLVFEEHEARENFSVRGKAVFGPHIDFEALQEVCAQKDVRVDTTLVA